QVLDSNWKDHLATMDHLRQGIHLRGYAQRNPKQEYKREAFELFSSMLGRLKQEVVTILSRVQVRAEEDVQAVEEQRRSNARMQYQHAEASALAAAGGDGAGPAEDDAAAAQPFVRQSPKLGRNDP